jgi:hypothetical protein
VLARLVHPSITPRQARQSITLLQKLKLIKKEKGRWVQTDPEMTTGDTVQSLAVEKFHLQNFNLAGESIDSIPAQDRDISCLIAAISTSTLDKVKEEIIDFRKKLIALIAAEKNPQRVYHISMQLFPTSEAFEPGD